MLRKTPLKAKRKAVPAAAQRHHDRLRELGCLVCEQAASIHHVTGYADKPGRFSRDHWLVVPLCPAHHQHDYGSLSVERLGHQGFFRIHGIDLLEEATRLAEETQRRAA